jgi:PAS domain S-box-containing protein
MRAEAFTSGNAPATIAEERPGLAATLRRVACALGVLVAIGGAVAVAGWTSSRQDLARVFVSAVPVNGNSAVVLGALGLALAILAPAPTRPGRKALGQAVVLLALGLAALTLLDHAFHEVIAVDRLLFRDPLLFGDGPSATMSPGTSIAALLLAFALLLIDTETPAGHHPSWGLALAAGLVPVQAIVGWIYGVASTRGQSPLTNVTLPVGVGLALLCVGILLARAQHGFVGIVVSRGTAGFTARRLLVAIVLLPVILGWLFVVGGLRAAQYDAMVGVSLVVVSAIVTGVAVVWLTASEIHRTDRSRNFVEDALRGEREWFRTTIASIADAVIAADEAGRVTTVNAVAEALTGFVAREVLGMPLDSVFRAQGADPASPVESPFERVVRDGRVADLPRDTVLISRDGTHFPVEGTAAPIRDARGHPRGVVLVFRDIRERRRVEQERADLLAREREARAEAEQASRAKDEFIATLSHELRTPLNSVLGWARLLRMGKLDTAGVTRAVQAIERGATTQAQIVDDLLDIARIVRGQLRLDVRPVDMAPVVEAAIDTVRPAAAARDIHVAAALEPKLPPVPGDPGRLQQIAWNLLTNAIKFTPAGGRVEVRLARRGDLVELAVHDTGAGIAPEFLPHVFERFRQADSSTTRAHGGLGLGLAIVRHLTEGHGGTVSVESAGPGLGSTFRVLLPVQQPRARVRDGDPSRRALRPAPAAPLPEAFGSLRVLVVDDDRDTLEVVRELLEVAGAEVVPAASVDEALDRLAGGRVDVLLSDIGMPGKDGYELIRAVRALPAERGGAIPAAALTAFTNEDHRHRALAAGYQMYLAKPIEPGELVAAVAGLAKGA